MKKNIVPFLCGLVFALGLGLSGMASPSKVLGFLDIASSNWDPSLMFVMVGAIGTHVFFARTAVGKARAKQRPPLGIKFFLPERSDLDAPLLIGAAAFGVGWGIAGYCPGPALVSAVATRNAGIFAVVMVASMWITQAVRAGLASRRRGGDHRV